MDLRFRQSLCYLIAFTYRHISIIVPKVFQILATTLPAENVTMIAETTRQMLSS